MNNYRIVRFLEQQCIGYRHSSTASYSIYKTKALCSDGETRTLYSEVCTERDGTNYFGEWQDDCPRIDVPEHEKEQ